MSLAIIIEGLSGKKTLYEGCGRCANAAHGIFTSLILYGLRQQICCNVILTGVNHFVPTIGETVYYPLIQGMTDVCGTSDFVHT